MPTARFQILDLADKYQESNSTNLHRKYTWHSRTNYNSHTHGRPTSSRLILTRLTRLTLSDIWSSVSETRTNKTKTRKKHKIAVSFSFSPFGYQSCCRLSHHCEVLAGTSSRCRHAGAVRRWRPGRPMRPLPTDKTHWQDAAATSAAVDFGAPFKHKNHIIQRRPSRSTVRFTAGQVGRSSLICLRGGCAG